MITMKRALALTTAALVSLSAIVLVGNGRARATTGSRSLIAIREHGTYINGPSPAAPTLGKFTLELAGTNRGPTGTTYITYDPSNPKYVNGEQQSALIGVDTLTSKTGKLELAFKGIHIQPNGRLTSSGQVVGPFIEYGTWTIKTATGTYAGWKGRGNWALAAWGYGLTEPYSVEWDGYITP